MSEKIETGKEVKESPKPKKKTKPDPFDTKRKELLGKIETHHAIILAFHKEIGLFDALQSIVKLLSGAKTVRIGRYSDTLEVSLPDIESLGVFFRELEHLKSRMPKVELTYSGKVDGNNVLAEVEIRFKEAEGSG